MTDGADQFLGKARQIVSDAADGRLTGAPIAESLTSMVRLMLEEKSRQTVQTLDEVIQVSDTRTDKRPPVVFVMTADEMEEGANPKLDINLTLNAYFDLGMVSAEARFRVKAEMGLPIQCHIEWMSAEDGGRKSGPPSSGYSAPVTVDDEVFASVVLTWNERAAGVTLLATDHHVGLGMMKPGAILKVCEGRRVVATVHLAKE